MFLECQGLSPKSTGTPWGRSPDDNSHSGPTLTLTCSVSVRNPKVLSCAEFIFDTSTDDFDNEKVRSPLYTLVTMSLNASVYGKGFGLRRNLRIEQSSDWDWERMSRPTYRPPTRWGIRTRTGDKNSAIQPSREEHEHKRTRKEGNQRNLWSTRTRGPLTHVRWRNRVEDRERRSSLRIVGWSCGRGKDFLRSEGEFPYRDRMYLSFGKRVCVSLLGWNRRYTQYLSI